MSEIFPLGGVLTKSFIIEAAGSPGYSAKRGRRSPSFILQSIVTWEGQCGGPLENEARALIGQFIARNVATPEFCGVGTRQLTNTYNKTISDGGITVDFWIIKVHTSYRSSNSWGSSNGWGSSNSWDHRIAGIIE